MQVTDQSSNALAAVPVADSVAPLPMPGPAPAGGEENLAEVAHEARNMVTALGLYCDLLEEPGVLAMPYRHYGQELRLVTAASRRLVERLSALHPSGPSGSMRPSIFSSGPSETASRSEDDPASTRYWKHVPASLVRDLAWELESNRNLLAALAGPAVQLTVQVSGGALPVRMTSEDLTRLLVNLVKNAVEAMPRGGKILLSLRENLAEPGQDPTLILNVEDNGPGFSSKALERAFDPGYSTRDNALTSGWNCLHRGLGLSIVRSVVEAAGGQVHAANRDPLGACIQIELPVRSA